MEDEEGFETIQKVHDIGFEIGNHTHTHAKLDDYSQDDQLDEIVKTNDIIEEAIGERPRFFRAPHGIMTDYTKQVIRSEEHTSELQSRFDLVCRLLLAKKKFISL